MTPGVPLSFEPDASSFDNAHLVIEDVEGGQNVSWPLVGLSIFVPKYKYYPQPENIEKSNGGLFRMHGLTGFSIGSYHEFILGDIPAHVAFRMGSIEVSFGEATPLAAYLFDFVHKEKYFGSWQTISSARITGVHDHEIAFINACIHYNEMTGAIPTTSSLDPAFIYWEEPENDYESELKSVPVPVVDIDPLRFYYHGLSQADNVSACIYFFRTLEFYSFLINHSQLAKLRHDPSLGDLEFVKRTLDLITKDEKGPLLKLVNQLADEHALTEAVKHAVIKDKSAAHLGEAIYAFRNSIVHGKLSYGYELQSTPVVGESGGISIRRELLRRMALKAIQTFGTRLTP